MERNSKWSLWNQEKRQGCPFSAYLFKIVLEVLARAIRQQKKSRRYKSEKKKLNSLFADDIVVYISDSNDSTKELLQLINTFGNAKDTRLTQENQ